MLPFFFAFDRQNYCRWMTWLFLKIHHRKLQMFLVKAIYSLTHQECIQFSLAWYGTGAIFNRDCKNKGRVIRITQTSAMDRSFFPWHEKAAMTRSVKDFCNMNIVESQCKELSKTRMERDKNDAQAAINVREKLIHLTWSGTGQRFL